MGDFKLQANGQTAGYSEYPLPNGAIRSYSGGATGFQLTDWLGTERLYYSYTGGSYSSSGSHAPFGENYAYNVAYYGDFTGQENDSAASFYEATYYFPERHYRAAQGRWASPDPAGLAAADPTSPQSWNRYAYALNNPLRYTDPLGLYCFYGGDGDTPENDGDSSDFNFDEHGAQGMADCASEGGQWEQDYTEVTVNGDNPGDVGTTTENGQEIFPEIVPQSYANCVKNSGNYFSLQNAVQTVSGGRFGNGPIAGALLGNPFSDVIAFGQSLSSGSANGGGTVLLDAAAYKSGDAAISVASNVPNISGTVAFSGAVALTTPSLSASASVSASVTGSLPLGSAAMSLAKGFVKFGNVMNAANAAVTLFSGVVCGIGR